MSQRQAAIRPPGFATLRSRLVEDAHVADTLCKFLENANTTREELLRVEHILLDRGLFLYEWQRYCMVRLLIACDYSSSDLSDAALRSVKRSESLIPRDLAMVIIGKHGTETAREELAKDFQENCNGNQIEQRASIIAVHELPFGDTIQRHVAPHIAPALQGMYKLIRNSYMGVYTRKRDSHTASEIINLVSSYV